MFSQLIRTNILRLKGVKSELVWTILGQLLVLVGGFVTIKILTNIMGAEEYGKLALGLTISNFINMFLYGPLGQVVIRFFSVYKERGLLNNYLIILKKIYFYSSVTIIAILFLVAVVINQFFGNEWMLILVLSVLFAILNGLNISFISLQNANRKRKIVALHQGGDIWLRLILSVIIIYVFNESAYFAFGGYVLSSIFITISQRRFAMKDSLIKDNWNKELNKEKANDNLKEFYSYAYPFILWSVFLSISMYSDRWILQSISGPIQVGIYVAIYQVARVPVTVTIELVNKFMMPIIFEKAGDLSCNKSVRKSIKMLYLTVLCCGLILAPVIGACYFFGDIIIKILTTEEFSSYYKLLWILLLSQSLFYLGQTLANVGQILKQPQKYLVSFLINAVTMVLFGYIFGQNFGVFGVAFGLLLSCSLYFITVVMINQRLISRKI